MSLSIDHSEVDAGSADSIDGASEVLEAKQLRRIPSYSKGVIISLLLILPAVCGAIMYSITSRGEQAMYEQKVGLITFERITSCGNEQNLIQCSPPLYQSLLDTPMK
jgi:hypothetical protein